MTSLNLKQKALLDSAKRYFDEGCYDKVSPLLNSLIAQKINLPDVYHMLGTIYYEQGQFKSSINSFKRALEIDPNFTDSSIGLSVVLNDLGKYEAAQSIFKSAQDRLKNTKGTSSKVKSIKHQIAEKHLELSDLYLSYKNHQKSFENLISYEELVEENEETVLRKVSILRQIDNLKFASQILKSWMQKKRNQVSADVYINLIEVKYIDRQPLAAMTVCEQALREFPENSELLNLMKNLKSTSFDLRNPEMTI